MSTFNDEAVLQSIFSPVAPVGDVPGCTADAPQDDDSGFDPELLVQVKELEVQGVCAAESGDVRSAVECFSHAIRLLPHRASAYNNRAQSRRLQGDTAGALEDLERAISLSGAAGQSGCQALVQRGLLLRLSGQDEEARHDFARAAELGSAFARHQAALLNPYAALCNRMLAQVIHKLRNPDVPSQQEL